MNQDCGHIELKKDPINVGMGYERRPAAICTITESQLSQASPRKYLIINLGKSLKILYSHSCGAWAYIVLYIPLVYVTDISM